MRLYNYQIKFTKKKLSKQRYKDNYNPGKVIKKFWFSAELSQECDVALNFNRQSRFVIIINDFPDINPI